ncbi:MAG: 4Fe-4S dicluster domain-containing protein, partial [Deltaproteobacteria bacterium]|nr:4Fe-4S dicluster domain-containing protein [Deltaproteobacteria bacterium]
IKLEGNPDHPLNRGALCARAEASLWNLYDPDRIRTPRWQQRAADAAGAASGAGHAAGAVTWDEVDRRIAAALADASARTGKVRLLTGAAMGPATRQAIQDFCQAQADARHVVFEPINTENIARAVAECHGGSPRVPRYRFDRAEMILSLGADFLGTWISPVEFAKDWAARRRLGSTHPLPGRERDGGRMMSRLVAFEPILSLTGTNADERYAVRADDLVRVAFALTHEIGVTRGGLNGEAAAALAPFAIAEVAPRIGIPAEVLRRIAQQMVAARGRALVVGGLLTGSLGLALQVAVQTLNHVLGAVGETVDLAERVSRQAAGSESDLAALVAEMQSGAVQVLVIAGVNPVYSLPDGLRFREALARVPLVVSLTDRLDETAAEADAVLPLSHYLESWGDAEPQAGVVSLVQPTIAPLYLSRTLAANLLAWKEGPRPGGSSPDERWYEYLRAFWRERVFPRTGVGSSFEAFWESSLRTGVVAVTEASGGSGALNAAAIARIAAGMPPRAAESGSLMLVCYPTVALYDGRHAGNSWLQELPDPVTKIAWDNYLCVAPRTAKRLGLEEEDVVEVRGGDAVVRLPVHIQPGTHEDIVAAPLGYGRQAAGRAGTGVGARVADLAQVAAAGVQWAGRFVTLRKTGERHKLAVTQGHHRIAGRPIIQEATLAAYRADPHAGAHEHDAAGAPPSMWAPHTYPGHRWGMAIDLSTCTGCSACVIGCQVENNVPAVGKKQVLKGREMHWIRIDRYYAGSEEQPTTVHQPMLCQHCEKAPCETVCPTLATVHDSEGLNLQIYNRCVGTRYCSNNCPYKVRRFNWFDYGNKRLPSAYVWHEPLHLMLNPDVTVREKGIMEKCTFCIQRIRAGKEEAKAKGIPVADGDIVTACQQACPTEAIVFGDLNDPHSRVARLAKDPRGYTVLRELNVLPQITYLTKIRNPGA